MRQGTVPVLAFISALAFVGCGQGDDAILFIAELRGNAGPPPVITDAGGDLTMIDNGNTMTWTLNARRIENVVSAHIHAGAAGQDGAVLLDLLPDGPPASFTGGTLSTRTFDESDIHGLAGPISMDSLRALMAVGNAYVDVHTTVHPGGEIRGQITRDN
jgi:hypothetical protein